ncbi:MAG: hypothetical protein HRU41_20215 [Saprospiraceae bacterium]|nr:hypothetical protein [Saprospiraceae bacterium]
MNNLEAIQAPTNISSHAQASVIPMEDQEAKPILAVAIQKRTKRVIQVCVAAIQMALRLLPNSLVHNQSANTKLAVNSISQIPQMEKIKASISATPTRSTKWAWVLDEPKGSTSALRKD